MHAIEVWLACNSMRHNVSDLRARADAKAGAERYVSLWSCNCN